MRDVLRSAAFLGRQLTADVLTRVARRIRPRVTVEEVEAATQVVEHIFKGKAAGEVVLSAEAQRMRDEVADTPPPEPEDEHAPPPPLRGSLEWRQRYGDSPR